MIGSGERASRWTTLLLIGGVAASAVVLGWLGYRAVYGWRESAMLLAERRAAESAERLATVLSRDTRGVQTAVLALTQGEQFMLDRPFDVRAVAASAFARYPYPESFFAWRGAAAPDTVVFLDRSDRRPAWMPGDPGPTSFPVTVDCTNCGWAGLSRRWLFRSGPPLSDNERSVDLPSGSGAETALAVPMIGGSGT